MLSEKTHLDSTLESCGATGIRLLGLIYEFRLQNSSNWAGVICMLETECFPFHTVLSWFGDVLEEIFLISDSVHSI